MRCTLLFVLLSGLIKPAFASDLMDVYKQALANDTLFKDAYARYMSSAQAIPQARAALYPQVSVSTQVGNYLPNSSSLNVKGNIPYSSSVWQVTASQTVFNYQVWAKVSQAKASVKAAQACFNDAAQDLILRTAKAYFNVLFAKDTLNFALSKKQANKSQLEQASQRFAVGLDSISSVYEAKAAYEQSIAQVIAAQNNIENQNQNLRKLTNHTYKFLTPIQEGKIPLVQPQPNNSKQWVNTGLKQNYKLLSAKYAFETAKETLKATSAGNWPVVSVQTNATQQANSIIPSSTGTQTNQTQANIALALNFPVFQGGLVQSQTRQAQYDLASYSEKLEQAFRDVLVNSRIAFNTINDDLSKVQADKHRVRSQQDSLKAVQTLFTVGERTMMDVVNAQQKLFEAQEQQAKDQYDLINSILNLKYLAGTLNVNDLELINSWLATSKINSLPANGDMANK